MHIEILVEDSSGARLIEILLPKLLGQQGARHSWRIHHYRGIGHIPKDLDPARDPAKRMLLNQLPRILQGYGNTPGIDAVVVIVDSDTRNCRDFLSELNALADRCHPKPKTLFRLAIEEIEAWYLGDREALRQAYPKAKDAHLGRYVQDTPCNTWELLADAIHPGGVKAVKKAGWPLPGQLKHAWAERIGPELQPDRNLSPSFRKFTEGITRLASGV